MCKFPPDYVEGSMWSWGNKKRPHSCRQRDLVQIPPQFQPIYGDALHKLPSFEETVSSPLRSGDSAAMRMKRDDTVKLPAERRVWLHSFRLARCGRCRSPGLFGAPLSSALRISQHLSCPQALRDGCVLVIPGLFLMICLSVGPSFSVDGKPRLCNINKPILKTIRRK